MAATLATAAAVDAAQPQRHHHGTYPAPQPNGIPDLSHSFARRTAWQSESRKTIFINDKTVNRYDERIQKKPDQCLGSGFSSCNGSFGYHELSKLDALRLARVKSKELRVKCHAALDRTLYIASLHLACRAILRLFDIHNQWGCPY
jgi:hypothetical protein